MVALAGGIPVLLPPIPSLAADHLELCRGIVFTGGDDPRMERFGVPTHPKATPMHPQRQEYEMRLLSLLDHAPNTPVLGVCLGMQLMSLHAGGSLNQHLPDTHATAPDHWGCDHEIHVRSEHWPFARASGKAASKHRQAVSHPGRLVVIAESPDAIIEGVRDPARPFYVGVQWHPERTESQSLGIGVFRSLIEHAERS